MSAKVSVVIPCYNASLWIRETLRSVFSQTHENLEVIAVDDGSTDDTAQVIEKEFGSVRLARTQNKGPAAARNLGTSMASGEFIQYLDADDLLAKGKIHWQLELLQKSGADVAYGDWQELVLLDNSFVPRTIMAKTINTPELDLFDGRFWSPMAAYLFRTNLTDAIGGWNESLPVAEDDRFLLDCAVHGARFIHSPGVVAFYRVHASNSNGTRSLAANYRFRHQNACEIAAWWQDNGGIDATRLRVIADALFGLARRSSDLDSSLFKAILLDLDRLCPGYVPDHPLRLKLASRLVGYRRAEVAALWYRAAKRRLSGR